MEEFVAGGFPGWAGAGGRDMAVTGRRGSYLVGWWVVGEGGRGESGRVCGIKTAAGRRVFFPDKKNFGKQVFFYHKIYN